MKKLSISQNRDSGAKEPPMAPLIDMIFILLIFFLVTTSFVKESGVEIQRPIAASAESRVKANLILGITKDGSIHVEKRLLDIRSVRSYMERFLAESPQGNVVIAADAESMSGIVLQVLAACRAAGIKNVSVAARKP
ncbi:MAG: biopolymer transporter ExbD [Desulfobacterales bacterium]